MAGTRRSRMPAWVPGLIVALSLVANAAPQAKLPEYWDVRVYISLNWDVLTRSLETCSVLADPKVPERSVLYLPKDLPEPLVVQQLRQRCPQVRIQRLPSDITEPGQANVQAIDPPGLLFLEHPYVVPGGMFNEMYGWDSYFILRGLLRDGRDELAQGMVRNFFFELEHYGAVLNANRTYYLTRSQPPFLSSMVLAVHDSLGEAEKRAWLTEALPYLTRDYEMWVRGEHLAGQTGLSRYFDFGEGPVPELDTHARYYRDVVAYFLRNPEAGKPYLREVNPETRQTTDTSPVFTFQVCEQKVGTTSCTAMESFTLTEDYYKGDRSMRESGFDVSFHNGPFNASMHHYASVDLNSLLYKTETDLERINTLLGRTAEARTWRERAARRKELVNRYLWDAQRGMYFDYDFVAGKRSTYEYATTFYPLWVGLASPEQARAVAGKLSRFEQPGGVAMSRQESHTQWDYPYGWAPIQLLTVEGLRRYGFGADADRLSRKFLDTVAEDFRRDGTIREKYNMVTRSSEVKVKAGYAENVVGFGWTNGVFLELQHGLQQEQEPAVRAWPRTQPQQQQPAAAP
ncbi:trehalase family glycosidase [Archangium lansingense]|uniref:Trehalase family glycosidase n=1 Tax=Archangium lansingense TaxID=2995310 RepID=A0ABT4A8F7_9BACT|nr:trehalase family glycosidase [Archangium lansinium]MCY1077943.1 trehalase family glycosidase [Archangium lansinium]